MDRQVRPPLSRRDIDEVKDILKQLTVRKRPVRPQSPWVSRVENAEKLVRTLALVGLAECAIMALMSRVFDSHPLAETVFAMSLLITLLGTAMLISPVVLSVPFFRTLYRTPFEPLFEALDDALSLDLPSVRELAGCEREALEYTLTQYRHQRQAFEKRGAMLAGSLDKIGFFPALVAFAMLIIPAWSHLDAWVRDFALLVPAFHFLNLLSYGLTQEMDRAIALLDYSVVARDRAGRQPT
ncbi:hypothetical protein J2778_002579 [Paraburkholderia graminis]|uniref:hypothetical protein n=1 Tax=Paraburkholderia graminis TaxID=60548 RepID=UPI0028638B2C|nr:hypothetical protein [Paraburkholderia graminis]MDR6475085.1 hypothetical protein [Paraburkholderia graminis]